MVEQRYFLSGGFPDGRQLLSFGGCPRCDRMEWRFSSATLTLCSECVAPRAVALRRYYRRKAQTVGVPHEYLAVAERDAWVCHLCSGPVDPTVSRRDPLGGTVDHLVPVSRGGGDEASNVALAHRRCNVKRGARAL